ncbi:hypothetical protein MY1884_005975 [Beauveria asiatica]
MASNSNNGNYTKVRTAGQKRRAPPPPPPPMQAPSVNHQMPVGRVGGPRQLPQQYQQRTELGPVPSIEQSRYTHHSQASYHEGIQGSRDAQNAWDEHDDHDRHNVQDVDPLSATLNDMNAPARNYDLSELTKYLCELSRSQRELVRLEKAKAEAKEKARSDAQSLESIKMLLEGLKLSLGIADQLRAAARTDQYRGFEEETRTQHE